MFLLSRGQYKDINVKMNFTNNNNKYLAVYKQISIKNKKHFVEILVRHFALKSNCPVLLRELFYFIKTENY